MNKEFEHAFAYKFILTFFGISFVYANLRYVVFGLEPLAHIPLFIMNKALSWSGLATIGLSKVLCYSKERKTAGLIGAAMIGMHTIISLIILRPEYLGKFYNQTDGMRMTGAGETAILFGVLGLMCIACLLWNSIPRINAAQNSDGATNIFPKLSNVVLLCGAIHVTLMGWSDWFEPSNWAKFGYLPPISMLSFLTTVTFLIMPNPNTTT